MNALGIVLRADAEAATAKRVKQVRKPIDIDQLLDNLRKKP
jgi:hypothetical protein